VVIFEPKKAFNAEDAKDAEEKQKPRTISIKIHRAFLRVLRVLRVKGFAVSPA
jgi:hypothetical protein